MRSRLRHLITIATHSRVQSYIADDYKHGACACMPAHSSVCYIYICVCVMHLMCLLCLMSLLYLVMYRTMLLNLDFTGHCVFRGASRSNENHAVPGMPYGPMHAQEHKLHDRHHSLSHGSHVPVRLAQRPMPRSWRLSLSVLVCIQKSSSCSLLSVLLLASTSG